MKFAKATLFVSLYLLFLTPIFAQEQLGLRMENYSGINSVTLNPANNLTSKFKWDVNLIAIGTFGENNYGYIRNSSLIHASQNADNAYSAPDLPEGYVVQDNDLISDYYQGNKKRYFSALTDVMGPSFMINLENGHSLGLFTRFRASASARNIDPSLSYYEVKQIAFDEPFDVNELSSAGMVWSEVGLNYALNIQTSNGNIGVGVNLKFLQGYEAYYLANNATTQISNSRSDTLSATSANFEFAFTDSNANDEDPSVSKNGNGFGLDLGAIMTLGGDDSDYVWKFGVSLLDIGKVNFNDNAQQHQFISSNPFQIASNSYESIDDVDQGIQSLSFDVLGDSTASRVANSFGIWLPGALSLQADYNLMPNVYINSTLVQRIAMGHGALKRDNLFAIAPRYESRWLSAALPLVLYNYTDFRMGMTLRLAFLTIGSDNIGSIFRRSDFSGSDFYVALKINPFNINLNRGGGKNVKCYDF